MTVDTSATSTTATFVELEGFEMIDGIACPIDPQDALDCESCQ